MNAATLSTEQQDARGVPSGPRVLSPAEHRARRRDLVDGFDDPTDEIMAREWDEQTRELADHHRADQLDGNRAAVRGKLK
jgi:hypothetical protein